MTLAAPSLLPGTDQPAPLVKRFLDYIFLECGLAGATVAAYKLDLRDFWDHLVADNVSPSDITITDIGQHFKALSGRGFALTSISRKAAAIKMFLRFLHAEKILVHDVASLMDTPKRWRTIPKAHRYSLIEKLLHAPDTSDELYLRDRALLELFYATGMRVSEVVDLTSQQINLKLGYLRCMGKGSKERIVLVGSVAIKAVRRYLDILRPRLLSQHFTDALFLSRTGRPLDRTNMWRLVRKYAQVAGIDDSVTPHTLRHTFATHLLANGVDLRMLQELLGHANLNSTQIYTSVNETQLKMVHQKYHPRP